MNFKTLLMQESSYVIQYTANIINNLPDDIYLMLKFQKYVEIIFYQFTSTKVSVFL